MLNEMQKNILVRALLLRIKLGHKPEEILATYKNLTDEEKAELLAEVK